MRKSGSNVLLSTVLVPIECVCQSRKNLVVTWVTEVQS